FCSGCGSPLAQGGTSLPPQPPQGAHPVPPAGAYPPAPTQPSAQPQPRPQNVGGATAAPARPTVVCSRCRGVNPGDMQFCQFCGAPLPQGGAGAGRPASVAVRPPTQPQAQQPAPPARQLDPPLPLAAPPQRAGGDAWGGPAAAAAPRGA